MSLFGRPTWPTWFSDEPSTPRIFSVGHPVILDRAIQVGGPGYVTMHAPRDPSSLLLPNLFYIVPVSAPGSAPRDSVLTRAIKYTNSTERIFPRWICIPNHGWRVVAHIKEVVYFYEGRGWPCHQFKRPMPLLERSHHPKAWAIQLPQHSLIDDRGIVFP